ATTTSPRERRGAWRLRGSRGAMRTRRGSGGAWRIPFHSRPSVLPPYHLRLPAPRRSPAMNPTRTARILPAALLLLLSPSACVLVVHGDTAWDPLRRERSRRVAADTSPEDSIGAPGLLAHIQVLASDDFEGRAPGTRGEEK